MTIQEQLDDLDTQISNEIRHIEVLLQRLYSVRIETEVAGYLIAWGKLRGRWCLSIRDPADPNSDFESLLSTTRHLRTQAFTDGWIQQLVDEAGSVLTKECEGRRKALSLARDVIIPELDARIKSL